MDLPYSKAKDGVVIEVKVEPRSSRNEIIGAGDKIIRIKLTAPPVGGAANALLIKLLAEKFGIRKRDVIIMKGESSRHKLIKLRGVNL
jgi:uncharacterized protein (TIGR00251 family)